MPVLRVDPNHPEPAAIAQAVALLRAGALVAFPTETVYGLGADARDARAVDAVFTAKGRPADNPLIVHLASAEDLEAVTSQVTPLALALAERFWPGPLTLVLPAHPDLPEVTTAGLDTVAVRVPDHAVARTLIAAADMPLAAPSANRSGRPSPTTAQHVEADLGDVVDLILDGGPCRVGMESTVVDARGAVPVVLRDGGVTREALGLTGSTGDPGAAPPQLAASPGTRHRHYQPSCRVAVAPPGGGAGLAVAERDLGRHVGLVGPGPVPEGVEGIARVDSTDALAAALYDALRAAETAGVDVVVVEGVEEVGLGRAVMDRLRRAAAG